MRAQLQNTASVEAENKSSRNVQKFARAARCTCVSQRRSTSSACAAKALPRDALQQTPRQMPRFAARPHRARRTKPSRCRIQRLGYLRATTGATAASHCPLRAHARRSRRRGSRVVILQLDAPFVSTAVRHTDWLLGAGAGPAAGQCEHITRTHNHHRRRIWHSTSAGPEPRLHHRGGLAMQPSAGDNRSASEPIHCTATTVRP